MSDKFEALFLEPADYDDDRKGYDDYDDKKITKWVIGIDAWSRVFVVKPPNIHPSFLEWQNAEEIGLPEFLDKEPGLYEIKCEFYSNADWETGVIDDYGFRITKITELLTW